MSDKKKYYYIKLKDNYFDQDNIRILESMKNGHTYSLILIKLYLKASKYDGKLMMTPSIPYDPNRVEILANVIGHDIDHVKQAIRAGVDLDLVTILDSGEIWMNEIQNMIGQSSTEADRIRDYRNSLKQKSLTLTDNQSVQMYDKSTPEIERELEKEKKKERDNIPPSVQEVEAYCNERNNGIDAEHFVAFYNSKGWMIGKNKMKDWKSAIITWEKKDKQQEKSDIHIVKSIFDGE